MFPPLTGGQLESSAFPGFPRLGPVDPVHTGGQMITESTVAWGSHSKDHMEAFKGFIS